MSEFFPVAHRMETVNGWWYMQDGALPHRNNDVFEVLDEHFHDRVIGLRYKSRYGGGIDWPPYSPDINPCDFFLWGYLKEKVYQRRPRTLEDIRKAIIAEIDEITQEMISNVISGFKSRLEELVDSNGAHFEQYVH